MAGIPPKACVTWMVKFSHMEGRKYHPFPVLLRAPGVDSVQHKLRLDKVPPKFFH